MATDFSLLLMDKKEGMTSFSSLGEVKRAFRGRKVGHAGTLDKFASGLMIVMTGGATKLNPVFSSFDKSYRATIVFGEETSTLDPEGEVVATSTVIPTREDLEAVLPTFLGKQKQVPPVYSALHVNGERAYLLAAKGKEVTMEERDIEIFSISLVSFVDNVAVVDCHVSKGTYIRSLARDIALRLGSRAHLIALRRMTIGPFSLEDIGKDTGTLLKATGLFSTMELSGKHRKEIDNGTILRQWILSDSEPERPYAFLTMDGKDYGIGEKGERLKVILRRADGDL